MWAPILKIFGTVFSVFAKALPFLVAFKAGSKKTEAKVISNAVEERQAGDKAANETKKKIRKSGVAEHVRKNKI